MKGSNDEFRIRVGDYRVLLDREEFGFSVDVEWARESGKFYILQSRPITAFEYNPALA